MKHVRFLLQVARPGFWPTSAWFYVLAMGGRDVFDTLGFWLGLVFVTFPMGLFVYGWNDIVDTETDRRNPRKGSYLFGARPTDEQIARLPQAIVAVQIPFFIAFYAMLGAKAMWLLAGLVGFSLIYNAPRWGFKNCPVLDLLNQAGYVLVFVLSAWLNDAPMLPWPTFLFGAMFAMHSHLLGAMMDIEPDAAAGRRTTAGLLGRTRSRACIGVFLAVEAALILICFREYVIAGGLACGALWFWIEAIVRNDKPYSKREMAAYLVGWNIVAIGSAPWIWSSAALVE